MAYILLTKDDFFYLNSRTIEAHGGNFVPPNNLLNESSLDYLIEAVDSVIFGQAAYPDIYSKAALYLYNTISNHIFQDGNKRTGLAAMQLFLDINGFQISQKLNKGAENFTSHDILFHFIIETAAGKLTFEDCVAWLRENVVPVSII